MGEMMNEAVDAAMDNNDLEEETDEEIAKVLDEILAGKIKKIKEILIGFYFIGKVGQLPSVVVTGGAKEAAAAAVVDVDSEEDEMERRLQALRS